MELSAEEKVFIETVKEAPGMSDFDFEKFRNSYPSLLNGICLSMKAMAQSVYSATDAAKKLDVAIHNLEKLQKMDNYDSSLDEEREEIINNTLAVIK